MDDSKREEFVKRFVTERAESRFGRIIDGDGTLKWVCRRRLFAALRFGCCRSALKEIVDLRVETLQDL